VSAHVDHFAKHYGTRRFRDRVDHPLTDFAREKLLALVAWPISVWRIRPCARLLTPAKPQRAAGIKVHRGGTYLAMEGHSFRRKRKSKLYRTWGRRDRHDHMPEANWPARPRFAAPVAMMWSDYDSWHPEHGARLMSDALRRCKAMGQGAQDGSAARPPCWTGPYSARIGCDRALRPLIRRLLHNATLPHLFPNSSTYVLVESSHLKSVQDYIRTIPDFPRAGTGVSG
jgi:hypothetical protein